MVAEEPQRKVVVCPLCAKAVTYFPEQESADAAVDRHTTQGCDPTNYEKVHNKRRCPVPNCKERITAMNVYRCRDCGVEVCLKHRYNAADHACVGKPVPGPSASARRQLGSLLRGLRMNDAADAAMHPTPATKPSAAAAASKRQQSSSAAGRSPKASSPKASGSSGLFSRAAAALQGWRANPIPTQADPANSIHGSAARRQQQHAQQQQRQQQPHQQQSVPRAPATSCRQQQDLRPIEVCADCGQRFDTIAELIAHAEAAHMGAAR